MLIFDNKQFVKLLSALTNNSIKNRKYSKISSNEKSITLYVRSYY